MDDIRTKIDTIKTQLDRQNIIYYLKNLRYENELLVKALAEVVRERERYKENWGIVKAELKAVEARLNFYEMVIRGN